jgi:hypothetical protein
MSLFVEVDSVEKGCPVIINLDQVAEIAPLREGGCALFFTDSAGTGAKSSVKVKNSYDSFKQFAMQTVTAEDIQRRIDNIQKSNPLVNVGQIDAAIATPATEAARGRGRPPKVAAAQ